LTASPSIGGVRSTCIQSRSKAVRLAQAKPPALAALRQALVPRRGQCQAHGEARHRSAVCAVVVVCTRQEAYAVKFFNQNAPGCAEDRPDSRSQRGAFVCLFWVPAVTLRRSSFACRMIRGSVCRRTPGGTQGTHGYSRVSAGPSAAERPAVLRVLTGTHGYPRVRLPNAKPGGTCASELCFGLRSLAGVLLSLEGSPHGTPLRLFSNRCTRVNAIECCSITRMSHKRHNPTRESTS
jgi:hypothetical protein